jgi:hypothetical protein
MKFNKKNKFRLKKLLSKYNFNNEKTTSFKRSLCANGCKLLIDTGTYLNYIPHLMFK